jgi:hypothetical protein
MRSAVAVLLLAVATGASAQTSSLHVSGFLIAREIYVNSQPSWSTGAFGRFDAGASAPGDHDVVNTDILHAGIDWAPATWLTFHADALARHEPSGTKGKRSGLVQAFADLNAQHWRVRAGMFWLPTSRENVDPLWYSRYSITTSAWNTWIGEEVRPIGIDVQYDPNFYVTLGATAFGGNDTMGTELAGHGWTFGNRMTVFDEGLPLAPPQADTIPIEHDLDHRLGHSERIRVKLPERASLQITHLDNRARLVPDIDGQTPWLTRFDVVGVEIGSTSPTTLAGEWSYGWTELVFPGGRFQMDFDTAYLLLTHKQAGDRWTVRVDRFSTSDHDRPVPDFSREHGHAVTIAWLHDIQKSVRLGVELARVSGDHPAAVFYGGDPRTAGKTITVEVRRAF